MNANEKKLLKECGDKENTMNVFEGNLIAGAGKVYEFTEITGNIYAESGKIEAGAFPVLTSNGGYISAGSGIEAGAFPVGIKKNDSTAAQKCRALLLSSFAAAGFSFADGILARIIQTRGPVSRVIICGKTKVSYLVTNGNAWSHGKTLADARKDLIYKIGSRDTTKFKEWTLDKVVTKAQAIEAYRMITGACAEGTKAWMEQRKTPEKITVKGIIELTKGAYAAEAFSGFFMAAK